MIKQIIEKNILRLQKGTRLKMEMAQVLGINGVGGAHPDKIPKLQG